jgi:HlyD family secretion protein
MQIQLLLLITLSLLLCACDEQEAIAVGLLASDRLELVASVAEPITAIHVQEGLQLQAGELLLSQNTDRIEAQLQEAQADLRRVQAVLAEQKRGPRPERIAVASAELDSARLERDFREKTWERQRELVKQNLGVVETLDQARMQLDLAEAQLAASTARLAELEAGTTAEELEQTRQHLAQLQARISRLEIERDRHRIVAPVDAWLDSLPFEAGEQPKVGDVVAVILSGNQPHARVYIPEELRVNIRPGDRVLVYVDGLEDPLSGVVRRIANDPAFTPYFSLTERDRSRLSYIAEITLPEQTQRLPDGVPLEVYFDFGARQ